MTSSGGGRRIAFAGIAAEARLYADVLVPRWLANGSREGDEWVSLNPTRADGRPGSFKVNLATGRWSDFATGDAGGDLVSLAAYLFGLRQSAAALRIAEMLGRDPYE
jgi:hypothetical protein